MAIPSPTIPSSITAVSAVRLNPTLSNMSFYVFSGEINVDTSETTMISVNDIGKRDIFIALEVGGAEDSAIGIQIKVKSNGTTIYNSLTQNQVHNPMNGFNEIRMILPANTSLEITLKQNSGNALWTIAGYGTYLGPA